MNFNITFKGNTRPMLPLNGACCAPYAVSYGAAQPLIKDYFKRASIPYCRLHDCCGAYGGAHFIDITNVFRNFDADENDPASYDFHYSDEYITAIQNSGCEAYYRLGETIEWGSKKYTATPPKDFEKWARICEHIVRHYNEGWADGFRYDLKYWEIWNEPENPGNPLGRCQWTGTKEELFRLYEVTSKHLRSCFPDIKIGGYGSCGFYTVTRPNAPEMYAEFITYFTDFLEMVKKTVSPFDFFSWHLYTMSETELLEHGEFVRETLDKYGFTNVESHLNEWNIADEGTGFKNKHTMEGGSFVAAVMSMLQKSGCVDKAMYYCFSKQGMYNGFIDQNDGTTSPAWYPFEAYGRVYSLGNAASVEGEADGAYAVAAKSESKAAVLISNYRCDDDEVSVKTDIDTKGKLYIIDEGFAGFDKAEPTEIDCKEFSIKLPKHTVAYICIEG